MVDERSPVNLAAIEAAMHAWRLAHPAATLTEIELELDRQLAAARAALLAQIAATGTSDASVCPDCGARLAHQGRRRRTLTTTGDSVVTLDRPYARCPRCGRGLFPPG